MRVFFEFSEGSEDPEGAGFSGGGFCCKGRGWRGRRMCDLGDVANFS